MKKRESMKWSTILSVLEQAVPYVKTVCPFLFQEPLMEKRLIAILDNIKQFNPRCETVVYSNMSRMTPELAREILETGYLDQLVISYYAPNQHIYELLQPPLNYRQTALNIRDFIALRAELRKTRPRVVMHYITLPELVAGWKGFFDEWSRVVDHVGFVHYDNFHGVKPKVDQTQYFGAPKVDRMIPCQRLWSQLNILSTGDVVPCCLDYAGEIVLGNVEDDNLRDIWSGKRFNSLRQSHMQEEYPELCRGCTVYEYRFTEVWCNHWLRQDKFTGKTYPVSLTP